MRGTLCPLAGLIAVFAVLFVLPVSMSAAAGDPCAVPVTNKVACENTKPGEPPSAWQIDGAGDPTIQGFGTAMSVNLGQAINFKIKTPASSYHIDILRLGYYDGDGARLIASNIQPSAKLPQTQPPCQTTKATGLVDCGNWGVSASWTVPSTAVSGLYMAHLVRNDTGGESQIFFVVRDDSSHSDVVVKTSDSTWQAYNEYGGNSLYSCTTAACPDGNPGGYKAAYAVSYNRPFDGALPRDGGFSDPFYAEYQLIRFLERNGYDLSYISQHDVEASPALLQNHKVFISSGHDEYWSKGERAGVEAARDAGVNLAFFSGNEMFWKTRWANSSDGSNTPYRTVITYKDTHFEKPEDPAAPGVTTGTWRDPRFGSPGDGGRPENNVTGQLFLVNSGTSEIHVPGTFSQLRFWRNTEVSKLTPGQTLTLAPGTGTLGYEWDVDADNGFRPNGRFSLSSTTVSGVQSFFDYGTEVTEPATQTHSLSLYRAPSGALVFGAGTVQWSWGLDVTNAWGQSGPDGFAPDPTMQQATVNLLADMSAQPATLQSNLVATTKSTDKTAPSATVSSPSNGAGLTDGKTVTISGTAADAGGGVVAGVEVSTDGGSTWHPASGTSSWSYPWSVHGNPATTIKARAVDDSGNIGAPSSGTSVSVACPCSIFAGTVPATVDSGDSDSVEVGMKFRSETAGTIDGIRFYKAAANTGTHVGGLWSSDGTLLAEGNFSNETATGWQQMTFSNPVPIQANTIYVAGYLAPKGHYSTTPWALNHPPPVGTDNLDSPPLHVVPSTVSENGLFEYTSASSFPTNSYRASNYWVDVLFTPAPVQAIPGQPTGVSAAAGPGAATVSWSPPTSGGTPSTYRITPYIGANAQTPVSVSAPASSKTIAGLTPGTAYTFTVAAINNVGAGPESAPSNSVTPTAATAPGAPTAVGASAGVAQASLNWTAPASDGGAAITGYRITPYVGATAQTPTTTGSAATSATVAGLTNGTTYTFKVEAINSVGTGPASAASNAVTPAPLNPPGPPTAVTATAKSAGAQIAWTAPVNNGGAAISGYRITPFNGAIALSPTTLASTATSASIGGLNNGTAYTFTVAAINSAGTGADSAHSAAVTPNGMIFDLATPGTVDSGDSGAVELGVKFQSDSDGVINGIRFYKAAANTGTHVGSLWSATGTLLAQATFANETASGWQQVSFSGPVAITANTTYVAGYYAPKGHYSVNGPTLASAVDNPPLHALGSATAANGVYAYGAAPSFPSSSYQASNYWVDVLFSPPPAPTAPGQPTGVSANAGLGQATVNWTAPASNGGSAITSYRITPYIGANAQTPVTVSAPASSKAIAGLTPGTAYTFKVAAINNVGAGPDSSASNSVTPSAATVPGVPTAVVASAGAAQVTVNWTAPASDGGSAITGYRVTPYIGATAQTPVTTGTGTSTTVTGLTNGTAYTFKVAAINAVGTGTASAASNSVTPNVATAPGTPTAVGATTAGAARATVTWTAPASNGGSPITGYRITPYIGATAQAPTTTGSAATAATVTGLTNGTAYTFKVAAINAVGTGADSVASGAVTPYATIFDLATPGTVDSGDSGAVELGVKFQSDSDGVINGIRFYKAAANTGTHVGSLWSATGTLLAQATFANETASGWQQVSFSGPVAITANTTYVAGYYAPKGHYSVNGPTLASAVDNPPLHALADGTGGNGVFGYGAAPVFPKDTYQGSNYWVDVLYGPPAAAQAPGQPTGVSANAGLGQATVNWTAPASNGGSAITSYRITPYIGANAQTPVTVSAPASSKTIAGLTPGTAYTFKVAAINNVGAGPDSSASNSVTPTAATAPGAPTALGASAGVAQASLNWTAPASDGGAAITNYRITPYVGANAQAPTTTGSAATAATVAGLTNGTAYTFKVEAINSVGAGPASAASNAVTPSAAGAIPGAPTAVAAAARSQSAIVNWTAPASDGGATITSYRITPYVGANAQAPTTTGSAATTATVTGLANGTAYTFTVEAINNVGAGPASAASAAVVPRATIFEQGVPAIPDVADSGSVVLGVKFTSESPGNILGIRFYKAAANTGTHVVALWGATGALLAQATATGESESGWQEVLFASPVAIAANTTYVAAYLAPKGHYSANGPTFATAVDSPPLHALADAAGGNGVYAYSPTSIFPSSSFSASNYWVDVLFTP